MHEDICVVAEPENHGHNYVFDCGYASKLQIADVMKTRAVFVTHTHLDHFAYFDFILRHRAGGRNPLTICGPVGIARNVEGKFQGYTWNLIGRRPGIEVRELVSDHEVEIYRMSPPHWQRKKVSTVSLKPGEPMFCFENIRVYHCLLDHRIPSVAYRMQEGDKVKIGDLPYKPGPWVGMLKKAFEEDLPKTLIQTEEGLRKAEDLFSLLSIKKGFHLGYAMDHLGGGENHQKLKVFFQDLDELWIESFFRQVDWDFARRHHHSTSYLSGLLAREAGVKKLNLVHHSRRYFSEIDDLIEEGRAAYEGREPRFVRTPVARYQEELSEEGDF